MWIVFGVLIVAAIVVFMRTSKKAPDVPGKVTNVEIKSDDTDS